MKRFLSKAEIAVFDLTVHSVKVDMPRECSLQVKIKRKNRVILSPIGEYNPDTKLSMLSFQTAITSTLYLSKGQYLPKKIKFRVIEHDRNGKWFRNGKTKINISEYLNKNKICERVDLPLVKSTRKNAFICISIQPRTESISLTKLPEISNSHRKTHSPINQKKKVFLDKIDRSSTLWEEETQEIEHYRFQNSMSNDMLPDQTWTINYELIETFDFLESDSDIECHPLPSPRQSREMAEIPCGIYYGGTLPPTSMACADVKAKESAEKPAETYSSCSACSIF